MKTEGEWTWKRSDHLLHLMYTRRQHANPVDRRYDIASASARTATRSGTARNHIFELNVMVVSIRD
jgi:hypothetical protein